MNTTSQPETAGYMSSYCVHGNVERDESAQSERLLRGREGGVSVALAFGWFALLLGRETLPLLLPNIISDLSITDSQAGLALTVMWATYALCHYPGGRLSDRLTHKTVLLPSLLFTIGGFVLLSFVGSVYGLLVAVCLIGIGGGAYYTANRGLLADTFVERRAEAFGVQIAAGSIGSAMASGLAIAALAIGTWQSAFVIPIALLVIVVLPIQHLVREPIQFEPVSIGVRNTIKNLTKPPEIRRILVVYVLFAFTWQGVMAFLPTFLRAEKDFSPELAGIAFASLYVVGMVMGPIAGNLGDAFDRIFVAAASLLLAALGLAALFVTANTALLFCCIIVFAVGIRSFPPVMQAFVFSRLPSESSAGDFGALKTVYTGIGSLGPLYVGIVASSMGYGIAFLGYGAVLFAATVALVVMASQIR